MKEKKVLNRELALDLLTGVEPETLHLPDELKLTKLRESLLKDEMDPQQLRQVAKTMNAVLRSGYEKVEDLRGHFEELPYKSRIGNATLDFLGGMLSIKEDDVDKVKKSWL